MPLSGFPLVCKYAVADEVYILQDGSIIEKTITGWRTTVDDPAGDDSGRQTITYIFDGLEVDSSMVFSSPNHVKEYVGGDKHNRALFSGSGGGAPFACGAQAGVTPSLGTWTDLAGFEIYSNFNNTSDDPELEVDWDVDWENVIADGTNFADGLRGGGTGYNMPSTITSKADFRALVKSYDEFTTIWIDQTPIGRTG